jgi:hypothetical protein
MGVKVNKHIIRILYNDNVGYKPIGPFETKELADAWLKQNGFLEKIPGHWEKRSRSCFSYYGMPTETNLMTAITSHLIAPEELCFVDLSQ